MFQMMRTTTRTRIFEPFVPPKPTNLHRTARPRARLEQSDGSNESEPLLSEIAEDFVNADDSGPACEKQLAEFLNNPWSKKFGEGEVGEL